MKITYVAALLLISGVSWAQAPAAPSLGYNFVELRFVDLDSNGGDGFRVGGSYRFEGNWFALGNITRLDFNNNIDATTFELGAGYIWPYRANWDFLANARVVRTDVSFPSGSADDTGFGLTGGVRGLVTERFEVRGSVNHINLDDNDTYLEIAGDYYFTNNLAAGLSLELAGDNDAFTVGARWYFR